MLIHTVRLSAKLFNSSISRLNSILIAGMTPLLAASVTGHIEIVEHLINLPFVKREDRIAALELIGATYVDKKRDMLNALTFWRRAMEDR